MSQTPVQTPDQTPVTGSVSPVDGLSPPPEGGDTGEPQKGNREARYRVERNEAREALTAAQGRIERMQRAEVERLASDAGLSLGSDVFTLSGNSVSDYLTEDGEVDTDKVAADVAAVLAERPGLRKTASPFDPSQGHGGKTPKREPASWADLLR